MNRAPAVVRKWRRVVASGCSHGDLIDPIRRAEVLAFKQRFKPERTFELGDVVDTAAFRHGARGSRDETTPIQPDKMAAVSWLEEYEPDRVAWGNHCWRLVEWMGHHNAIVSAAAGGVWNELQHTVAKLKAQTRPYHIQHGWFHEGGVFWGHGYMFNQNAVRDHAEMLGGRVVMAHLHTPEQVPGRVIGAGSSFCVGTLADVDKMTYADRNRSKVRWGAGVVFGEMCETESVLWLASAKPGEPLRFPPGL